MFMVVNFEGSFLPICINSNFKKNTEISQIFKRIINKAFLPACGLNSHIIFSCVTPHKKKPDSSSGKPDTVISSCYFNLPAQVLLNHSFLDLGPVKVLCGKKKKKSLKGALSSKKLGWLKEKKNLERIKRNR